MSDLAVGTHAITATYSGDGVYDPDVSTNHQPAFSQSVAAASTSTTTTSDLPNPDFGDTVTFTATVLVTAPGAGDPTGDVAFSANSVPITGCSAALVTAGTATCATNQLGVGVNDIDAVYSGDGNFLTSSAPTFQQSVDSAVTSTGLVSSANPSVFSGPLTFTATVSSSAGTPTGTVDFRLGGGNIPTCTARAMTAGVATCSTADLSAGPGQQITAHYLGNATYATSNSSIVTQTVTAASTTTAVTSNDTTSVSTQSITFTATISPVAPATANPTNGTVNFTTGGITIAGCAAQAVSGGVATCTTAGTPVGDSLIAAVFAPAQDFTGSTSPNLTQTVAKAATTTVVGSSDTTTTWNDPITLTATIAATAPATVTPSAGTVSFNAGGVAIATCGARTMTAGVATCTTSAVPGGTNTITAVYSGDTSYLTSSSPSITQTVATAATVTSLISDTEPSRFGQAVTLTATVTSTAGVPTGSVDFYVERRDLTRELIATEPLVNGTTSTIRRELSVRMDTPIIAEYTGDGNFGTSTDTVTQTVYRSFTRTLMSSSANPSTYGQLVTLTVEVRAMGDGEGTPRGKVAFYRVTDGIRKWIGTAVLVDGIAKLRTSKTPVGVSDMIAQYNGNGNFRPSSRTGVQRVHAA